jgi:GNAT superfamily N-acetyltransferase
MFIELWIAHRIEGGTPPEAAQRLALDGTLRHALQRDDICAFIAFTGDQPSGYVVLADSTRSLLVDSPCVSIDMLFVLPEHRRQGVARSLLTAAARYADRQGAEHLASTVPAGDRDANRFFARLGFSSQMVRRVTSVSALRRRLGQDESRHHTSIEALLHRRRSLRARATASATADGRLAG